MKRILIVTVSLIFYLSASHAQFERYQSMYIYNFARMVEWPDAYKSGEFVIGILGGNAITSSISQFTTGKKIGTQSIRVNQMSSIKNIGGCHILFVSGNYSKNISEILAQLEGKSTLVITESEDLINSGASISFVNDDGKLKYYYNAEAAKKSNLKVSSSLENMALTSR